MLLHRVISSTVIIAALLAVALWVPEPGLVVVVMIVGMMGAYEFARLLDRAGAAAERGLIVLGTGAYLGALGWGSQAWGAAQASEIVLAGFALWFAAIGIRVLVRADGSAFSAIGGAAAAVAYTGILFGFILLLLTMGGRLLPLYMILLVKVTDSAAYLIGSAVGRHKAFPRISPGKTWEGCLGGVAASMAAALLVSAVGGGMVGSVRIPVGHALVLGALLAVTGIVGDLLESMFKRAAGVKDSGSWIRGMGGVLDVIDSLLLASPVLYLYARLWLT